MSARRFPWWPYWLSAAVIIVLAAAPLISVIVAGSIADANGCRVDEGSVHPCLVNGVDMGETLYALGVLGWLMLVSLPFGLLALAIWLVVLLVHRTAWKRRTGASA